MGILLIKASDLILLKTIMLDIKVDIPSYSIQEKIYTGSKTVVYRATRSIDQKPVVIKLMQNDYPSFNEIVHFRNQYIITNNLNISGIVKPCSLEIYRNGYALIMEDFGGISLKEWGVGSGEWGVENFLVVGIQIATILDQLHRNRVIHKDIKPANIIINPTTKQVKIIDFSISTLLPRETQQLQNPNVLEGTLAYISPEQTGRMNRGIDYRTDFYSLGVTFYELLTGELPFNSNEPIELVHCHIAKQAVPVHSINKNIPIIISDIIAKLMAKNAEDRYQSALGLKHDLEVCLHQYKKSNNITSFVLGSRDISESFLIPEKLYGRETEVETLLQAFERVTQGATEIMLVAGLSGIGKTAVVNEVHKPIVRQRGYFIKGKYDQFQRNIPFSAFVQCFRDLIKQLLSESNTEIHQWQTKILDAVGENGQIIIDVIPELEMIIGKQQPVPELSGSAAESRFNFLFQKFTQVFTNVEHPLVIFLDDLQWSDSASLKLMQLLITDTKHLLLIGAYRDNEVNQTHPLMLTLGEISKVGTTINSIVLTPLSQWRLNELVADTLKCEETLAFPLSQLVSQKTQGNPFFATQFLKALHQDGLIQFNFETRCWQCDITQVNQQALTDDVVAFMAFQLRRLPKSTQRVLQLAACISNQFDLGTLAIVSEESEIEVAADLWKALEEGLILPITEVYKFYQGEESDKLVVESRDASNKLAKYRFLHDRVQQAAYSLIPDTQKQFTHLKIGRLLLENTLDIEQSENLFDIVNHFNIAVSQIESLSEREQLAKLNLLAGQKAKTATAFSTALNYFHQGIILLQPECWQTQYSVALALHESAVEAAYLNGNFAQMEELAEIVFQQAKTLTDKIRVYNIQIQAYTAQNKLFDAVKTALTILQLLGITFPESPAPEDFQQSMEEVALCLNEKSVEDLSTQGSMTDKNMFAAMQILSGVASAVYISMAQLYPLIILKKVSLSLKYGVTLSSTYAYATYGLILCAFANDIEGGYRSGTIALNLLEKFSAKEFKAKVFNIVYSFVWHWKNHLQENLDPLLDGYQSGIETGDLEFAAYCAYNHCQLLYWSARELSELADIMNVYNQAIAQIKQETALNFHRICQQTVLNLINNASDRSILKGEVYDEDEMLPIHQVASDRYSIGILYVNKLVLSYLFCDIEKAIENATIAEQYADAIAGNYPVSIIPFYSSLSQLGIYHKQSPEQQKNIIEKITNNQVKLEAWAKHAPMNHLHKWYLVEAEQHRILGEKFDAIECYDKAINLAKESKYTQEEALANELAAKFYLEWDKEKIAQTYLIEAYYCYTRWGAKAKVEDLEKCYSKLLTPIFKQQKNYIKPNETITLTSVKTIYSTHSSSTTSASVFDFAGFIKASQFISSEIELEKLLSNLMQVVLENAGAKKSALILQKENNLFIEATANISNQQQELQTNILQSILLSNSDDVPQSIINYVKNSLEILITPDATTQVEWTSDSYIQQHKPKSILCMPIIKQSKLIGILYLENSLTIGAFTIDRVEILNLLISQAAISLDNARLYQQSQEYSQQLEKSLEDVKQSQIQLVQSEKMSALGNLVAGVAHEINNPVGFIAGNIQPALNYVKDILNLVDLYQQKFPNPGTEIEEEIETIDLDYIRQDLPKLLTSMKEGTLRIRSISHSLRIFSRSDKENKVPFKIHDGIDSTLLILQHRLKANENRPIIEVITNYGEISDIMCFPGQLNQVFMNLLANSIDALEESNIGHSFEQIAKNPNCITVTTNLSPNNQQVIISIKDNGKGMSEEVKQRIFDHLFTTKAVGKGTGLGLAIAHQIIVEKHGGSIEVNSQLGEGAEFVIAIPIN
jgi:predicted ATPase/signal transduction histidine kinase